ncbi:uncharacterized protein [Aquarana catesbeiana]|uniref:uncharacterized protein n=1 Tax=Aquarana catesbeiana TaxID=8400 RepID=UPI003CC9EB3D
MLEIFHNPVEKMEDKSDNVSSLCEDGLRNKRSGRKRQPAGRTTHMSTSVGRETTFPSTVTAPSSQTKTSNPDSCEKEKFDGRGRFAVKKRNIRVKEEHVSSGEEDISGKGEEFVSSREANTSRKGKEHGSSREADTAEKGEEHVSFREADTSRKGEKRVSSREADRSGKGKEHVSSAEEDPSSGEGDLGSFETVLVQDSPVTRHKQGWNMLKFNIGRSREISEDLRKQVVEAHKSGKGYKRIAKDLDLHQSTVRQIVYKWKKFSTVATLPRSGRPTKISAKARCTILKHLTENPRVTAKDLKASLALDNINVHESTIRKTLNKWCSWDFTMEEDTALQQE